MWKGSVSNRKAASRRSTRIAVQPPRSTAALVDDEDSMDIDVETVETNGHNEDDYESVRVCKVLHWLQFLDNHEFLKG